MPKKSQCRYVSESIQVSRIPFTLPVTLSRTVSALRERAATRESGAPPVNYGSFTPAGISPRYTHKTQRWKAALRGRMHKGRAKLYVCCQQRIEWKGLSLPVPAGCIRARPQAVHSLAVRLCLLLFPLLAFASSHLLLAFSIFCTVSLSFSQHLCESTCVAAEDPAVVMAYLSLSLSLALPGKEGQTEDGVCDTVRKMMEGISENQRDKCPKKEEKQLLAACDADERQLESCSCDLWLRKGARAGGEPRAVTPCACRIGVRMREVVSYSINLE